MISRIDHTLRVIYYYHCDGYNIIMIEVHNPTETVSCPTCEMHFAGVEQHKLHYKSDLHRYNVKRKLVRLPPVTEQMFSTKRPETK